MSNDILDKYVQNMATYHKVLNKQSRSSEYSLSNSKSRNTIRESISVVSPLSTSSIDAAEHKNDAGTTIHTKSFISSIVAGFKAASSFIYSPKETDRKSVV